MMRRSAPEGRPLFDLLSSASITGKCVMLSALESEWASVVGERLAMRTAPKAFDESEGILVVAVDAQAAMHDLNFKKNSIIRTIRTRIRIMAVRDIKAELGRVSRPQPKMSRGRKARKREADSLDPASVEALRLEISSNHPDLPPELAATIARCRIMSECRANPKNL